MFEGTKEQFKTPAHIEGVETEDIDLGTEEGLRKFLANAEETYSETKQFERWAKNRDFEGLSTEDLDGEIVYEELFIRIQNIRDLAQVAPEELSDDEVIEMQHCYDDIIKLRDHLIAAYEKIEGVSVTEDIEPEEDSLEEEVVEVGPAAATEEVESGTTEAVPEVETTELTLEAEPAEVANAAESLEPEPEAVVETAEVEEVAENVDQSEIEAALTEAKDDIGRVMLSGVELRDRYIASGHLTEGGVLSESLGKSLSRAKEVQDTLRELSENPADSAVQTKIESCVRTTREISKNISAIEDVLERKAAAAVESTDRLPGLTTQKAKVYSLLERANKLKKTFEESGIMHPDGVISIELGETIKKANAVEGKLNELTGNSESDKQALENYTITVSKLKETLDDAERFFEKKKRTTKVAKAAPESESKEVSEEAVTTEISETEVVETTESEVAHDSTLEERTSLELLPTEADVAEIVNSVQQNQFIANEERATVQSMVESYHRAVAEKKDVDAIRRQFKSLNEFVQNLDEHPPLDYIPERIDRILERVSQAPASSDEAMSIRTFKENFDRMMAEDPDNEARLIEMYKNIESTARNIEDEWLTVSGMRLPQVGAEGVFGARSFREGLLVARDRHPEFVQDPEKQVLVDKMVRMLSVVPNEGLTDEQVSELKSIAREIDVHNRIGQKKEVSPERQPVAIPKEQAQEEQDDEPTVRNGKLNITSEDNEGSISLNDKTGRERSFREATQDVDESDVEPEESEENPVDVVEQFSDDENEDTEDSGQAAEPLQLTDEYRVETVIEEPVADDLSEDEESALAEVEEDDPVNEAVPEPEGRPTVRSWQERRAAAGSLVGMDGLMEEYQDFFDHYEPTEFDRVMRSEIAAYERKLEDGLEKFLGIERNSAFGFMKDMTLAEIGDLLGEYGAGRRSEFQEDFNVSYNIFVSWCDQIDEMERLVETSDDMTFGELYARWIIEQELR